MKILKRFIISIVLLVVVLFIVLAVIISTLDLNEYKEQIQKLVKEQTGRDLAINGDLDASFFPWIGISIGELELSNAKGFGEQPFARIGAANVKVEVLPLLNKEINVNSVELEGLALDLQTQANGVTNWDDLINPDTPEEQPSKQAVEETGSLPITALAVGGISISNANISWLDNQGGTDAKLEKFNLKTGEIALNKPFPFEVGFEILSSGLAVQARIELEGNITADLENQKFTLTEFIMNTKAEGEGVPIQNAALGLGGDIIADLGNQKLNIERLFFEALGIELEGNVVITSLSTDPQIMAALASKQAFSLRELFKKLEIEEPVTADDSVMNAVSLNMSLEANTKQAILNDLTIKLDDTTFKGKASVLDLAGDLPPVRFNFNVDAIDVDRYLPPPALPSEQEQTGTVEQSEVSPAPEDIPIELPLALIRKLDIVGEFSINDIKVSNLTANNIMVPITAKDGVIVLDGIGAKMYEGNFSSTVSLDAKSDIPSYATAMSLAGVQAEPLLKDLLQDDAPLSGKGDFNLDISTMGSSVNGLKAALNGGYGLSFMDGAINGINIGYQLRKAQAAIKGQKLDENEQFKKTDFSTLKMTGKFTNGVMFSDDLDMRAPGLRLEGTGTVDLNKEFVDYKLKTLLGGSAEGQGGRDKSELTGLKITVPIRGHFNELSTDFTKVILQGMKEDFKNNLKAEQVKVKLKLKAKEAEAKAELKKKAEAAKAKFDEKEKQELKKLEEKATNKLKDNLKGLFN